MSVRHKELPTEAVQFHAESILTMAPGSNYNELLHVLFAGIMRRKITRITSIRCSPAAPSRA
jgi:hypothetical protein